MSKMSSYGKTSQTPVSRYQRDIKNFTLPVKEALSMLSSKQIYLLVSLGIALWALVTVNIRLRPDSILDPIHGLIPFVIAPLGGWLSVWLCKVVGRLSTNQLLPGTAVAGAVAMMMDGAALKWFSGVYGFDEKLLRLAAAGLLWGYGVALAVAVIWVARSQRQIHAA
jgi:hypothetical protein